MQEPIISAGGMHYVPAAYTVTAVGQHWPVNMRAVPSAAYTHTPLEESGGTRNSLTVCK